MHPKGLVSHLTADEQSTPAVGNFYFTSIFHRLLESLELKSYQQPFIEMNI